MSQEFDTVENLRMQISYWKRQIEPTVSHINKLRRRLKELEKKKSNTPIQGKRSDTLE